MDAPLLGIDEPAEASAARDILLEPRLLLGELVAGRSQLHREVRTHGRKLPPLCLGERVPARRSHPRQVRGALGAVGEQEPGRRVEPYPGPVAPDPRRELADQIEVAPPRVASRRWHDDKLSVAGTFDAKLAVRRAEVEEVIVSEGC